MDIKNLKFSAEEIDSLLNKIKNLDLSNIEANANIDLTIGQVETVENIENASASNWKVLAGGNHCRRFCYIRWWTYSK